MSRDEILSFLFFLEFILKSMEKRGVYSKRWVLFYFSSINVIYCNIILKILSKHLLSITIEEDLIRIYR